SSLHLNFKNKRIKYRKTKNRNALFKLRKRIGFLEKYQNLFQNSKLNLIIFFKNISILIMKLLENLAK
ncbi:MAG: hypothetical protein LC768_15310, partial [Acidobacteria bacterium]|nr:hypothetical protein [Acidobacteriota bacterium]MCA1639674.1 hypothetical protein [Acidobacteriota bacterium]